MVPVDMTQNAVAAGEAATLSQTTVVRVAVDLSSQFKSKSKAIGGLFGSLGFEFVEEVEQASVVVTDDAAKTIKNLLGGHGVIMLPNGADGSADALVREFLTRNEEFATRYRVASYHTLLTDLRKFVPDLANSIHLPRGTPTATEVGLPDEIQSAPISGKRILVVDDNDLNRRSAVFQFGEKNTLEVLGSYIAAAELLKTNQYDYVFLDLLMPTERFQLSDETFARTAGSEFPVGGYMALIAAASGGATVMVATDANHHQHPAAAVLDFLWNQRLEFANGGSIVFKLATVAEAKEGERVKDWYLSLQDG